MRALAPEALLSHPEELFSQPLQLGRIRLQGVQGLSLEDLQGLGYFGQTYERDQRRNNRRNNVAKDHKTAALAAALLLSSAIHREEAAVRQHHLRMIDEVCLLEDGHSIQSTAANSCLLNGPRNDGLISKRSRRWGSDETTSYLTLKIRDYFVWPPSPAHLLSSFCRIVCNTSGAPVIVPNVLSAQPTMPASVCKRSTTLPPSAPNS
jgi:hypothetical protein